MKNKLGFYCSECGQPLDIETRMENGTMPYEVAGEIVVRIKPCEICQKRAGLRSRRAFNALSEALSYAKDEDAFVEMVKKINPDSNI